MELRLLLGTYVKFVNENIRKETTMWNIYKYIDIIISCNVRHGAKYF